MRRVRDAIARALRVSSLSSTLLEEVAAAVAEVAEEVRRHEVVMVVVTPVVTGKVPMVVVVHQRGGSLFLSISLLLPLPPFSRGTRAALPYLVHAPNI